MAYGIFADFYDFFNEDADYDLLWNRFWLRSVNMAFQTGLSLTSAAEPES